MANGYVIPASDEHIQHIAENMREADKVEVIAAGGKDPLYALGRSLRTSTKAWTAMNMEDQPIFMFGVGPRSIMTGKGIPWLLGTDEVLNVRIQFIRECREYLNEMHAIYPRLSNFVDVRNDVSIRWLKWMGFKFDDAVKFGVNGEMFYPFHKEV